MPHMMHIANAGPNGGHAEGQSDSQHGLIENQLLGSEQQIQVQLYSIVLLVVCQECSLA